MNFETAFTSGLVTGVLAKSLCACQPKRLRRRLRAENALTSSSLATCNMYEY